MFVLAALFVAQPYMVNDVEIKRITTIVPHLKTYIDETFFGLHLVISCFQYISGIFGRKRLGAGGPLEMSILDGESIGSLPLNGPKMGRLILLLSVQSLDPPPGPGRPILQRGYRVSRTQIPETGR